MIELSLGIIVAIEVVIIIYVFKHILFFIFMLHDLWTVFVDV